MYPSDLQNRINNMLYSNDTVDYIDDFSENGEFKTRKVENLVSIEKSGKDIGLIFEDVVRLKYFNKKYHLGRYGHIFDELTVRGPKSISGSVLLLLTTKTPRVIDLVSGKDVATFGKQIEGVDYSEISRFIFSLKDEIIEDLKNPTYYIYNPCVVLAGRDHIIFHNPIRGLLSIVKGKICVTGYYDGISNRLFQEIDFSG